MPLVTFTASPARAEGAAAKVTVNAPKITVNKRPWIMGGASARIGCGTVLDYAKGRLYASCPLCTPGIDRLSSTRESRLAPLPQGEVQLAWAGALADCSCACAPGSSGTAST